MDFKTSKSVFNITRYVGLVLILGAVLVKIYWPIIVGAIILLGGIVQATVFYRCPHCRKPMELMGKIPKHCPECEEELVGKN